MTSQEHLDLLGEIAEHLNHIGLMLKGINRSLQNAVVTSEPIPEETTVSGGARTTDPPKDTLMLDLQPFSDFLRMDQGKIYINKFIPKDTFKEIAAVMRKHEFEYQSFEDWKESHWRKK